MRIRRPAALLTIALATLAALQGCQPLDTQPVASQRGTTTTIIMVRHAERDPGSNPPITEPLNAEGLFCAQALADRLRDEGITAIYLPDLTRNRQTIEPLLERIDVDPVFIDLISTLDTRALANRMAATWLNDEAGGVVLWVGNTGPANDVQSGNLQEIYWRLGGEDRPPTGYSDLYFIEVDDSGQVLIDTQTYNP